MNLKIPKPGPEFKDGSDEWYAECKRLEDEAFSSFSIKNSHSVMYGKIRAVLKGKVVVDVGGSPYDDQLVIDYVDQKGFDGRVIIGYTELGMWIKWHGERA